MQTTTTVTTEQVQEAFQPPLKVTYISDVIVNYMSLVLEVKSAPENLTKKLLTMKAIYIMLITFVGAFLITLGVKFRSLSLQVIILFVIYSTLKSFQETLDPFMKPIHNFFYTFNIVKNMKVFGDPNRMVLTYLVVSLVILTILIVLMFWARIIGLAVAIYVVYRLYKNYVTGFNMGSPVTEFLLVALATILFLILFGWIARFVMDIFICFLGCSIIMAFVAAYFDIPDGFDEFYPDLFVVNKILDNLRDVTFYFIVLPTLACAMAQRVIYSK